MERLGLEPLSVAYIDSTLAPGYGEVGFEVTARGVLPEEDWLRLQTSWAKRLRGGAGRSVFHIVARACSSRPRPFSE